MVTPLELLRAFEEDNLKFIAWESETIGVLSRVKETFRDNVMQQWCDYFISISQYEIENLTKEIEDDRRKAEEFSTI